MVILHQATGGGTKELRANEGRKDPGKDVALRGGGVGSDHLRDIVDSLKYTFFIEGRTKVIAAGTRFKVGRSQRKREPTGKENELRSKIEHEAKVSRIQRWERSG